MLQTPTDSNPMAGKLPPLKKLAPLTPEGLARTRQRLQSAKSSPPMQTMTTPIQKIDSTSSFERSRSAPVGPAQRRQLPEALLRLEPRPLSAYDVFDEITAAGFLGLTAACLKKSRQRRQGPDYTSTAPMDR
jgi:hypothetical protein